jgi:hypothetical protein
MQKNEDELKLKNNDYKVSVEVAEIFKKTVEDNNIKITELEDRIGEANGNIAKYKALKYDIIFAAKEGFKKAIKKNHFLTQALSNLDNETAGEIKAMFEELGYKI